MAVASFATTAATTGLSFIGQSQAASAQAAANQATAESARQSAVIQHRTIRERTRQEREAAAQGLENANRSQRAAQGRAFVAAGEGGVTGNSVNALIGDIAMSFGRDRTAIRRNLASTERQLELGAEGINARTESTINSLPRPQEPDPFGAGLQIIGGGINAYNNYERLRLAQQQGP